MKTKKTLWITLGSIGAVVVLLVISLIGSYNSMASSKNDVENAWSQVEVSYQRRADLIPNLVKVAQQASVREQDILTAALNARSKALSANVAPGDASALARSQAPVDSALSRLLALNESYPDLKSNQNWTALQSQLEGTENRVAVSRSDYNDAVRGYDNRIVRFPGNILAGMFGFQKASYFAAQQGAQDAPSVMFDNPSATK
jgi:LemA protein